MDAYLLVEFSLIKSNILSEFNVNTDYEYQN